MQNMRQNVIFSHFSKLLIPSIGKYLQPVYVHIKHLFVFVNVSLYSINIILPTTCVGTCALHILALKNSMKITYVPLPQPCPLYLSERS